MRDFKQEIDTSSSLPEMSDILNDLTAEIERLAESPYEDDKLFERIHDLELILRYGEMKMERLLT